MTRDLFSPPRELPELSQDDVHDMLGGYLPKGWEQRPRGGGKTWARLMGEFLSMADPALETPEVRAWLDECESIICFGSRGAFVFTPSQVVQFSKIHDPDDWSAKQPRFRAFMDEVSTDARAKAVRCEARPHRLLRSVLPTYL
jgi:hypothetical protein